MSMDVTHLSFTIAYRQMINDLMFNVTDRERTLFYRIYNFLLLFLLLIFIRVRLIVPLNLRMIRQLQEFLNLSL